MKTFQAVVPTAILAASVIFPFSGHGALARQEAAPAAAWSCDTTTPASAMGMMGDMPMAQGTATVGMGHMAMDLDQMYVDMMIPHHASIIAMAQAALPRLTDERLQEIAQAIIAAQDPEIEELRGYRQAWYGDAAPMPMDPAMMTAMEQMMPDMMAMMSDIMPGMPGMMEMMPGMMERMPGMSESMAGMALMMNPAAQVAAVCAAQNADLAFIDLTVPHHQMAIAASEMVLQQATHAELRDFAQRVIAAQQREIDELTAIRAELVGSATPTT